MLCAHVQREGIGLLSNCSLFLTHHCSLCHICPSPTPTCPLLIVPQEVLVSHRLDELGACLETPARVDVCDALGGGTARRKCATTHTVSEGSA